uniref:Putative secreted peptide n=1 Tax=Anopheles braziliensis TaxID=58242 RepID=A0A2M3ZRH0_9DIPT
MALLEVLIKLVRVVELLRAEVATVQCTIVHSTVDFQDLDLTALLGYRVTFRFVSLVLASIFTGFLCRRIFPCYLQLVYVLLEYLLFFALQQDFVPFLDHHAFLLDVIRRWLYLRHELRRSIVFDVFDLHGHFLVH